MSAHGPDSGDETSRAGKHPTIYNTAEQPISKIDQNPSRQSQRDVRVEEVTDPTCGGDGGTGTAKEHVRFFGPDLVVFFTFKFLNHRL